VTGRRRSGLSVQGARALVTGASSGIGAAVAQLLTARGAKLLVTGRDAARLEAVATVTGAAAQRADLVDPGAADAVAAWAGPVDVLVCNAGRGWSGPLTSMPAAEVGELVTVNLTASAHLVRLLLPAMLERGRGAVVLLSSIAGELGVRDEAVYAATKAGLAAFGESLRYEVGGSGVGVSVVLPGAVATPFFDRRGRAYDRRWPRPVPPEAVAGAVVRAVERGSPEVFVPRWLVVPARLHGAAPWLVRPLQRRVG
jgi:short-subunit dehydrogenase